MQYSGKLLNLTILAICLLLSKYCNLLEEQEPDLCHLWNALQLFMPDFWIHKHYWIFLEGKPTFYLGK